MAVPSQTIDLDCAEDLKRECKCLKNGHLLTVVYHEIVAFDNPCIPYERLRKGIMRYAEYYKGAESALRINFELS